MSEAERSMEPVNVMAAALTEHKNKNGYTQKIYKAQSDEHKSEALQADLENKINALKQTEHREKIDFSDFEMVKQRTLDYLMACQQAAVFPSVMGLSVHGFGVSRQALNQYLQRNPSTRTAEFINEVKDLMADILTNAALYRNADAVSVIFQLKNHFDHSDRVQIEPVQQSPIGDQPDQASLEARIMGSVVDDE